MSIEPGKMGQGNKVFEIVSFVLVTLALALLIVWRSGLPIIGIDDANIFFVYARNLAHGGGFVYNFGGERVEGFSSLLWLLTITPFFWLMHSPEKALFFLSVLLTAGTITIVYRFVAHLLSRHLGCSQNLTRFFSFLVLAWCFGSPAFIAWSAISLMDIALWTFLNACFFILSIKIALESDLPWRRIALFCLSAGALILVRPESQMLILLVIPQLMVALYRRGAAQRRCFTVAVLATYLCTTGLLFGFRLSYFGFPFPNTYYAKVSPDRLYNIGRGLNYVSGFLTWNALNFILIGAAVTGVLMFYRYLLLVKQGGLRDKSLEIFGLVSIPAVIGMVLPLVGGGDHFREYRFYQPFWPWFSVAGIFALIYFKREECERLLSNRREMFLLLAIATVFISLNGTEDSNWPRVFHQGETMLKTQTNIAFIGRETGTAVNYLVRQTQAVPSTVGVFTAGGFGWAYEGNTFDMLGLNDVTVAHSSGDRKGQKNHAAFSKEVFWKYRPDIMLPNVITDDYNELNPLPHERTNWFTSINAFRGLLQEERFHKEYIPCIVSARDSSVAVFAYYRRDYIERMGTSVTVSFMGDRGWR